MSTKAKKTASSKTATKEKKDGASTPKKEKKVKIAAEPKSDVVTGASVSAPPSAKIPTYVNLQDPSAVSFEAGQIFSKFDTDHDGKLDKHEFTELIRQNPELLMAPNELTRNRVTGMIPTEIVSNRVLTHFDETAGVAISRWEVDQHRNMGNIVTPLVDAYKVRYDKLRSLLTGKLLPKREHLLQLRRQLQNISIEVDAKRRSIERETLTDTEQILERLRAVESMRQSSIKHQVLQVEEEMMSIERLVRRVEQANVEENEGQNLTTGVLLTSAVPGSVPVETIRPPRAVNMVEVIHEFGDLCASINRLSSKPVTVQIEFPTDDFPKETSERLEVLARCDKYVQALRVKDHMLWTSLREKDKLEESLQEERRLCQEYANEVANWAEMSKKLSEQLLEAKQRLEDAERRNVDLVRTMREHNIHYDIHE